MLLHIDTDMGVDDGLALAIMQRLPNARIVAVSTVFGNVSVDIATRNALIFRRLLRRRFAVFAGAGRAADGYSINAEGVHGSDGLGGATRTVADHVLRAAVQTPVLPLNQVQRRGRSVVLVGLGPATNLPSLIDRYGTDGISRIVLMSGVFFDRGNVTSVAEFNAHCDPVALDEVLSCNIPVTFVPLDIARKILLTRGTVQSYLSLSRSQLTRLIVGSHMAYMDSYRQTEGIDGCFPHDALAILVACRPNLFHYVPGNVHIGTLRNDRGRTQITIDKRSKVNVATGGDLRWVRNFLRTLEPAQRARMRTSPVAADPARPKASLP
jgi:purine nucleosidase